MTEPEFMYEGGASYESVPVVESDYKEHSTAEKIDLLKKLEKETLATSDKIKKIGYCEYDEVSKEINILNSKGLNLNKKYSYVEAFVGALAEENDQTVMGYSVDVNFKLNDLDTNKIVKEASEMAVSQLGAGSVNSGRYPVVLKRDVATPILAAFSSIFEGSSALLKTTILTDKIGQKVFGDNITIYDDPFYSDSLIKVAFDDEGVPCKTKKIVEKGVFKGFLHNLKTANYFNVEPTGNGFKEGVAGKIGTGPTNMFIEPGNLTKDEIISTVEKGIFVTDVNGLHAGLNPISGDFNVIEFVPIIFFCAVVSSLCILAVVDIVSLFIVNELVFILIYGKSIVRDCDPFIITSPSPSTSISTYFPPNNPFFVPYVTICTCPDSNISISVWSATILCTLESSPVFNLSSDFEFTHLLNSSKPSLPPKVEAK